MEATTQPKQRRESTFLTLLPYAEAKTAFTATPVNDTKTLSPASEVVPTVKTHRSTSESSTSSELSTRFLRLGHGVGDE